MAETVGLFSSVPIEREIFGAKIAAKSRPSKMIAPPARLISHLTFNEYSARPERAPNASDSLQDKIVLNQAVPDFEAETFAHDIANALTYLGWNAKIVDGAVTHLSNLSFADGPSIFSFPGANGPTNNGVEVQAALHQLAHEDGDDSRDIAPIVLPVNGQSGYPRLDPPVPGAVLIRVGVRQLSSRFFDIRRRALERDTPKAKATH